MDITCEDNFPALREITKTTDIDNVKDNFKREAEGELSKASSSTYLRFGLSITLNRIFLTLYMSNTLPSNI